MNKPLSLEKIRQIMSNAKSGSSGTADARNELRKPFKKKAVLHLSDGTSINIHTIDIAETGMGVLSEHALPTGIRCTVAIEIFSRGQRAQSEIEGTIIYCILKGTEGFRLGIRITKIDPALLQLAHI